jgi:hypothetical protein
MGGEGEQIAGSRGDLSAQTSLRAWPRVVGLCVTVLCDAKMGTKACSCHG